MAMEGLLAVACASPDQATRRAAYDAIGRVCRTGTHLFIFADYVQRQRGWGRGLRQAVAKWYTDPPVENAALGVRDLMRGRLPDDDVRVERQRVLRRSL